MDTCLAFVFFAVLIGQSESRIQNLPNNVLAVGNSKNNDANGNQAANQLNNPARSQSQQNLVQQFRQNQFAQQNLAGNFVWPNANVKKANSQAKAKSFKQLGNIPSDDLNNPDSLKAAPLGSNSGQERLLNRGNKKTDPKLIRFARKTGAETQESNQQPANNQNQVNQLQNNPALFHQGNQVNNQGNQVVPNNPVRPSVDRTRTNPLLAGDDGTLNEDGRDRGQLVKGEMKVPTLPPTAEAANQNNNNDRERRIDTIASDDRQKSSKLEHRVDSVAVPENAEKLPEIRHNDNIPNFVNNPPPVNNGYQNQNGGGIQVNAAQNNFQRAPERDIGGIKLTWDWSDFSITFDDYGGAEMKVRRAPHSTTGEPWPLPQYYVKKEKRMHKLDKDLFTFKVTGETCDIIQDAVERYRIRVLEDAVEDMYDNLQNAPGTNIDDPRLKYASDIYTKAHVIAKVDIKIRKPCQKYPSVNSDESYDLVIKKSRAFIWANEVWGALRGLETFSHIVWRGLDGEDPDDRSKNANLFVRETVISDYPRFPHRGVLIDSSRHFFFKETIFDILDGMEQNKMNVLHWHIVDDQSFPYQSEVFPDLSKKGAFHPTFVYSQRDIAEIIDYARFRGIRVMPEFDTPGHTYSWGLSRPELLTQCYQGSSPVKGYLGPIDPTKNSTYGFLKTLFAEILDTFKDQYIHLGGDEVPLGCWQSNPDVVNFGSQLAKQHSSDNQQAQSYNGGGYMESQFDVRKVYEYYENRLMKDLREIGSHRKDGVKFVMWQEVMNNDLLLPNDTIIEVWMGDMADVNRAISMGYQVLYATCWYLDHVDYGTKWPKYYQCDPADNTFGYMIDEKKVLGGEACLWSEYIDNENMMTTLWPRASAVAERLWSAKDVRDLDSAGARLSEHRCRMLNRGLSIGQISGPDYCLKRGIGRSRDKYRTNSTCTSGRCVKSRDRDGTFVEMEDIDFHRPRRRTNVPDCNKVSSSQGGMLIFLGAALIILLAVGIGVKSTSGRFVQPRICKNRTILILFVSVLLIYIMCYTSIWVQVFDFSGTNSKLQNDIHR